MQNRARPLLDPVHYLNQAEWDYLAKDQTEFRFPLRRPSGLTDFYERLDQELRAQSLLRIDSYRQVKEGFTFISRPAALALDLELLLRERPYLPAWKNEIENQIRDFRFVDLRSFLLREGPSSIQDLPLLRSCLEVLGHLISDPEQARGLLPRQLAHGQSTKLIGRENLLLRLFSHWRGEPAQWKDFFLHFELLDKPLEFRIYAPRVQLQGHELQNYHGILAKDWADESDFQALRGTLIVENFESFLSLTDESRSTLLIWGSGWKALHLRSFWDRLPRPIYYWGDMDKEGYEIFGALKSMDSGLRPVLMDLLTIERYRAIQQRKEIFLGPFRAVPGLQNEYEFVARHGILIEQEQMREPWPFGTNLY